MTLTPIQLRDALDRLADYAVDANLTPRDMGAILEKRCMEKVLEYFGNNQSHVAQRIGIHRNSLRRRIQNLEIPMQRRWKVRKKA